jgi:hypothetical protein
MTEPTRQPEAEIIPPGAPLPRHPDPWRSTGTTATFRVRTVRLGPGGMVLLALGLGAAATIGVFILLGAALISLAAIGALTVGAAIAGLLRRPNQPLR